MKTKYFVIFLTLIFLSYSRVGWGDDFDVVGPVDYNMSIQDASAVSAMSPVLSNMSQEGFSNLNAQQTYTGNIQVTGNNEMGQPITQYYNQNGVFLNGYNDLGNNQVVGYVQGGPLIFSQPMQSGASISAADALGTSYNNLDSFIGGAMQNKIYPEVTTNVPTGGGTRVSFNGDDGFKNNVYFNASGGFEGAASKGSSGHETTHSMLAQPSTYKTEVTQEAKDTIKSYLNTDNYELQKVTNIGEGIRAEFKNVNTDAAMRVTISPEGKILTRVEDVGNKSEWFFGDGSTATTIKDGDKWTSVSGLKNYETSAGIVSVGRDNESKMVMFYEPKNSKETQRIETAFKYPLGGDYAARKTDGSGEVLIPGDTMAKIASDFTGREIRKEDLKVAINPFGRAGELYTAESFNPDVSAVLKTTVDGSEKTLRAMPWKDGKIYVRDTETGKEIGNLGQYLNGKVYINRGINESNVEIAPAEAGKLFQALGVGKGEDINIGIFGGAKKETFINDFKPAVTAQAALSATVVPIVGGGVVFSGTEVITVAKNNLAEQSENIVGIKPSTIKEENIYEPRRDQDQVLQKLNAQVLEADTAIRELERVQTNVKGYNPKELARVGAIHTREDTLKGLEENIQNARKTKQKAEETINQLTLTNPAVLTVPKNTAYNIATGDNPELYLSTPVAGDRIVVTKELGVAQAGLPDRGEVSRNLAAAKENLEAIRQKVEMLGQLSMAGEPPGIVNSYKQGVQQTKQDYEKVWKTVQRLEAGVAQTVVPKL